MARPIVFLSDYGLDDEFVGVCHGVMARLAPDARVIDLTHAIPPQDVIRGAAVLAQSARFMPQDSVFLAIVDPEVGTGRAPVAVEAGGGALLVGRDNGLLSLAWDELGGPVRAVEITSEGVALGPVSATFHGRDVFAPAAAHLALGMPLGDLGPELPAERLHRVELPRPEVREGVVHAVVLSVDRFGNLQLSATAGDLERAGLGGTTEMDVTVGEAPYKIARAGTFADVRAGGAAMLIDSTGHVALVVNKGDAAAAFGVGAGDPVTVALPGRVG